MKHSKILIVTFTDLIYNNAGVNGNNQTVV